MGTLTLTELDTELAAAHANRDDFSQARRIVALNLAQMRIARLEDWNELQVIYTGTIGSAGDITVDKFADIPGTLRKIHSFKIVDASSKTNSRKLKFVPQRQWDTHVPETEAWATGIPSHYTIWDKRAEFYKIPDTTYTSELRVGKWPTAFASATPNQVSDLDNKDDMIISLAASWGFLTFREMEEANRWFAIFKDMYKSASGHELTEHELEIKPSIEQFFSDNTANDPWTDPFNRTGVK